MAHKAEIIETKCSLQRGSVGLRFVFIIAVMTPHLRNINVFEHGYGDHFFGGQLYSCQVDLITWKIGNKCFIESFGAARAACVCVYNVSRHPSSEVCIKIRSVKPQSSPSPYIYFKELPPIHPQTCSPSLKTLSCLQISIRPSTF